MAELQGSALINCSFIPSFIPSGTYMLFDSTNAPTGWTKNTTHNDKALRLVSGSVSTGGSTSFSTILSSARAMSSPGTDARQTGYQFAPGPGTSFVSIQAATATVTLSAAATAGGTHVHPYAYNNNVNRTNSAPQATRQVAPYAPATTLATGSGQQHPHGSLTARTHPDTVTGQAHLHPISESPHAHGVTFDNQTFAVYYRDIILASKT